MPMSTPEASHPPHRNGFDVILGNPPWERVKLQDQEFFAQRDPLVAGAPNAATRKIAIAALKETNPALLQEFADAMRQAEGESHLLRSSGRFPLCGRGDINTYAVFAESMRNAISPAGRLGVIVPTGVATDDTTKFFFSNMVETRTLVSYFGFKNERFLFPRPVEHTVTFGLLTVLGRAQSSPKMDFCWLAWTVEEMNDPARRIVLTTDDIERLNPNTRTCPVFRSERDAEVTKAIYRQVPVLIREAREDEPEANPWDLTFVAMFHMANASGLFIDPEEACPVLRRTLTVDPEVTPPYLPLYEAKMLHQFDHRWATYALPGCDWLTTPILTKINREGKPEPDTRDVTAGERANPAAIAAPRYWVTKNEVEARLIKTDKEGNVVWRWDRDWLLGFRDIARNTDDRTLIATVIPRVGVSNKIPLMVLDHVDAKQAACLIACLNSFAVDYSARQKVGGATLNFFIVKQFPILSPSAFATACPWDPATTLAAWIAPRVLELVYTAHDLAGFARDLDYSGAPFRWDPLRRSQIRAELDAAFFHLYGISRDDAAYILDTFLVFKAREEERNGGIYKTKLTILGIYDEMAGAMTATPVASPIITPAVLPPTRAQIDRGRAAAYLTLLAATWNKPVERQAIEYALVLMLNDTVRAKLLAQPRAGAGAAVPPAQARPTPSSPTQTRTFVQGLDAMISLLNSNQVLSVTTHAGTQRIELGLAGSTATQSLPQSDWAKAKDAVAAFEVLRANLQRLDSLADAKDLEFSVA
jgi:hypothetical protein